MTLTRFTANNVIEMHLNCYKLPLSSKANITSLLSRSQNLPRGGGSYPGLDLKLNCPPLTRGKKIKTSPDKRLKNPPRPLGLGQKMPGPLYDIGITLTTIYKKTVFDHHRGNSS